MRGRSSKSAREAARRLEGIVASAMDGIITIDEGQSVIQFNPAAERMFGVAAAEALGQPISRFLPERHRETHAVHVRRFVDAGATSRRMGSLTPLSGLRADGVEFPIEASISQVRVGRERLATVILRDITRRQAAEEARLLLAREVDHRAKNALAVVQAVISLTRAPTTEAFAEAVRGRVAALGRAHSLLAQSGWRGADLHQVIADETGAFGRPGQVLVDGPAVTLAANAVQPVSQLIHELATNAFKYGALSAEGGRVSIETRILASGELELRWTESGGPPVAPPKALGFGSTLIEQVGARQLGGRLDMRWLAEGLTLSLTWPRTVYRATPEPAAASPGGERPDPAEPAQAGRVLVVEDEVLIALEMAQALRDLGWTVVGPAATLAEALRLVEEAGAIDAAVLDLNLGGELVYPVAERLRVLGVPIVFCTGYEEVDRRRGFEDSVIVRKPMIAHVLAAQLQRARHPN